MEHGHDRHPNGHSHSHAHLDYGRAFAIGIALNLVYVVGEAVAGIVSGSLALIADAGHNLGDVLSLSLAWGAAVLSRRRPSDRFTYGLRSSSILAAVANAIILLVVTGGIAWEGVRRVSHPVPVVSGIVIWVAAAGILVNGVTALLFASGRPRDLNLKSAFLHMAADTLVTAALNAVPEGVDAAAVRAHLLTAPGVIGLHDLHIWGMSTTETALTCHLVMPGGHPGDAMLNGIAQQLHHRFGIHHATIQIELADTDETCVLTPEHVV